MAECKTCGGTARQICEACAGMLCSRCINMCCCGRILCDGDMKPDGAPPSYLCRTL